MNQILLKKKDNSLINIFYDERTGGLSYRSYGRKGWQEPVALYKSISRNFHAMLDSQDIIHVAFSDKKGTVYYGRLGSGLFKSYQILKSKEAADYDKNITLVSSDKSILIFYYVKHNDKNILSVQNIDPDTGIADMPTALDYIDLSSSSFFICRNSAGKINIIYKRISGEYGIRLYNPNAAAPETRKGSFIPIEISTDEYNSFKNINIKKCFSDTAGNLKILAEDTELSCLYYMYIKSSSISETPLIDCTLRIPQSNSKNIIYCDIVQLYKKLFIYWYSRDDLYITSAGISNSETDIQFSPPEKHVLGRKILYPVVYHTNADIEKTVLFGSITNGCCNLAGNLSVGIQTYIHNPLDSGKISGNDIGGALIDSLKLLKDNIERIDNALENDDRRLTLIEEEIKRLELKINKLEISLKSNNN